MTSRSKFLLTAVCILLTLSACTDSKGATEAVKNHGLEPIEVGGYSLWGCSEGDTFKTKFTAKRADGQEVKGVVCRGLFFKGTTVRFK